MVAKANISNFGFGGGHHAARLAISVIPVKHSSGSLFTPGKDHKFYREYMIKTHGLDSVTCKY